MRLGIVDSADVVVEFVTREPGLVRNSVRVVGSVDMKLPTVLNIVVVDDDVDRVLVITPVFSVSMKLMH